MKRISTVINKWSIGLDVLRAPNFRRYYFGQSLSNFGDMLVPLALAFAVLDLTGSVAALGMVMLASRVPIIVFTLIGGAIGDSLPRRKVMLVADAVRLVAHGATGALLLMGDARLWHLIVLQVLAGSAAAFFDPAASGLVRNLVEPSEIRKANSLLTLTRNGITIIALAASGAIIAILGPGWAFVVNSITFLASITVLLRMDLPDGDRVWIRTDFLRQVHEGLSYVRHSGWLSVTIVYTSLLNTLVIAPMMILGPAVSKSSLGGAAVWAAVLIASTSGSLVGSALSLKIHPRRPLSTAIGVVFAAIPLALTLAFVAPLWLILPAAVLFGMQSSFSTILISSLIQQNIAEGTLSRVMSVHQLGARSLTPLGFALVGVAAARWGTADVLLACAAWTFVSTSFVVALPRIRTVEFAVAPDDTGALSVESNPASNGATAVAAR